MLYEVITERRADGPERVVGLEVEQVLLGLHRRHRHPVERKQQHEQERASYNFV